MQTPSYNNPLLLPNVQYRNPLTLPNSIPDIPTQKQEKSSNKETKEDELKVDGLIGHVNAWQQGLNHAKNTMSDIIAQYGIGNAAYAQKYDKDYQQANATLNALTSPAYLNQMKRYKESKEDFEKHIENGGNDRGEEIDIEHYGRTGQIRSFNYVLDAMEEDPNFDFVSHSDKPNLTTIDEARKALYDFMNVKGYEKEKSQGVASAIAATINETMGMIQYGNQRTTGRTQMSNNKATMAAANELANQGLSTDVMTGLMRGFLNSSKYSTVLKNHDAKTGDVRESEAYQKALSDYIHDEIQAGADKNFQNEDLKGDASVSLSYSQLPQDIIRSNAQQSSIVNFYTGMGASAIINGQRQVPGADRGKTGEGWATPKGANGQRDNYQIKMYNTPEVRDITNGWSKDIASTYGPNATAAQVGQGSYFYDINTGQYWDPASLAPWKFESMAGAIYAGADNPTRQVKEVTLPDGRKTIQPGPWTYNARSEGDRASAEVLSESLKANGNYGMAQQIGNMGAAVSTTLVMSDKDFKAWAKNQKVNATANWTFSKAQEKEITQKTIAYYKSKGYKITTYGAGSYEFYKPGTKSNISLGQATQNYLQTAEGKKHLGPKNAAASRDFTTKKSLYGSGVGYNDDGILIEYASSFQKTTDADGNKIVQFTPLLGADNYLLSNPAVIEQHTQSMIEYDRGKMNQENAAPVLWNATPF